MARIERLDPQRRFAEKEAERRAADRARAGKRPGRRSAAFAFPPGKARIDWDSVKR
jgi:hypothetical protein